MLLLKKRYKALDVISLAHSVSPLCMYLYIILSTIKAILPVAALAVSMANFVDTALAIAQGYDVRSSIYMPLVLLLVVFMLINTIDSIIELFITRIRLMLGRMLNPAMVRKCAALDYKHIENLESWELISRVTRDPTETVIYGLIGLVGILQIVVGIASFFALVLVHVWWAVLIIAVFSVPLFWLAMWAGKKRYQSVRDSEKFSRRADYLDEVLTDREYIDERSLFNYSSFVIKDWKQQFEAGLIIRLKAVLKTDLINKVSSLTLVAIAALVALTLIAPVIAGDLSAGMFMGVVTAVYGLVQPLGWQLTQALRQISQTEEYMKDLTAFMALSEAENSLDEADAEPKQFSKLEFCNVSFKYPTGDRYVLNNLSFVLESSKHYAFVGKNGSGKTTITKLLTGLYTGYEGDILINGKELRTYPASFLKGMFSVIYQDFAKYYISFGDNIALGANLSHPRDSARKEQIAKAASLAGLDDTIASLKDKMDTPLGRIKDGGQDISEGQWQRVAIARSLISRAPIKILDEPTAALDPISESQLYEEFEKLADNGPDSMTIFISHRLGSTKLADEILVIDDGKIVERGTHHDLIAAAGLYANMFESQKEWYQ